MVKQQYTILAAALALLTPLTAGVAAGQTSDNEPVTVTVSVESFADIEITGLPVGSTQVSGGQTEFVDLDLNINANYETKLFIELDPANGNFGDFSLAASFLPGDLAEFDIGPGLGSPDHLRLAITNNHNGNRNFVINPTASSIPEITVAQTSGGSTATVRVTLSTSN